MIESQRFRGHSSSAILAGKIVARINIFSAKANLGFSIIANVAVKAEYTGDLKSG